MPTVTKSVLIHNGRYEDEETGHPLFKWMKDYTDENDNGTYKTRKHTDWHCPDITYHTSDGTTYVGEDAWRFRVEELNRFTGGINDQTSQLHLCWDEDDGYTLIVLGSVYGGFEGVEGAVKDDEGKAWATRLQAAYHCRFAKGQGGPQGILLKEVWSYVDPMPAVKAMLQHGIVKPSDLGLG